MPDLIDYDLCINHCKLKSKLKDAVGTLSYYCGAFEKGEPVPFEHTYITSVTLKKIRKKDNPNFNIPPKCPYQLEHLLKRQEYE